MAGSRAFSRRLMLRSGGAAAGYALCASRLGVTALAQGAADRPRGAAHHRLSLGTRDVFELSDGHLVVPPALMAATDKHIPFPGLGWVERRGSAFAWVVGV